MKCIGFDNRSYNINVTDYIVYGDDAKSRSQLHVRARAILKRMFPCDMILEEVKLPGSKKNGDRLFADFLLPGQSLMVEVHGEQHYKFNRFFHNSIFDFINSQKRDQDKRDWCELNNIVLVELPFGETDEQWERKISIR